jgi:hypothetical protein
MCQIIVENPSSGILPGLEIISKSVFTFTLTLTLTITLDISDALMNFNPRAAFVGERLDHIALFNHTNKALLVGPIR